MENFTLVYDITEHCYLFDHLTIEILLFLFFLPTSLIVCKQKSVDVGAKIRRAAFPAATVLIGLVAILECMATYPSYKEANAVWKSGKAQVIQGTVENIKHSPRNCRGRGCGDTFSVSGIYFFLPYYQKYPGYHPESGQPTPVQPGTHVRIAFFNGWILRFEVAAS